MKIIITVVASLFMAGFAFAALSSTSAEKHTTAKSKRVELALGKNRPGQTTPSSGKSLR